MEKKTFYLYKQDKHLHANILRNISNMIRENLLQEDICVEIKKAKKEASSRQRGYLWGVVYPCILDGLKELGNEDFIDTAEVHEFMKLQTKHYERIETIINNKKVVTLKFKSIGQIGKLDETMEYIDKCIRWAGEWLGVTIPEPEGFK